MICIVRIWRNWAWYCRLDAWAGVITLAVAVVCDCMRLEIVPRSIALDTLRGGGYTVCRTLILCAMPLVHSFI